MSVVENPLLLRKRAVADESGPYVISKSLKFDQSSLGRLYRTFSEAGNQKKWTYSTWIRIFDAATDAGWHYIGSGNTFFQSQGDNDTAIRANFRTNGGNTWWDGVKKLRDETGWYHVCINMDMSQGTDLDKVKIWINGELEPATAGALGKNYRSTNTDLLIGQAAVHNFFNNGHGEAGYEDTLSGYVADTYYIDGQNYKPNYFAKFDQTTGVWVPKAFQAPIQNDGTVWSSGVSGSIYSGDTAAEAFDGNTGSSIEAADGNTLTWTIPAGKTIEVDHEVRVYARIKGSTSVFQVNGQSYHQTVKDKNGDNTFGWVTLPHDIRTLTEIKWSRVDSNHFTMLAAVEVDGKIIQDSTTSIPQPWHELGTNSVCLKYRNKYDFGLDSFGETVSNSAVKPILAVSDDYGRIPTNTNLTTVATDENAAYIVAAVHGADNQTVNIVNHAAPIRSGGAATSCNAINISEYNTSNGAPPLFYGTNMEFNGSSSRLIIGGGIDGDDDYAFGSGAFTIEYWVRPKQVSEFDPLLVRAQGSSNNDHDWRQYVYNNGSFCADFKTSGGDIGMQSVEGAAKKYEWQHLAVTRDTTTNKLYMYVNGELVDTESIGSSVTINDDAAGAVFGTQIAVNGNTWWYEGAVCDIRVYKGVCKYPGGTQFKTCFRRRPWSQSNLSGDGIVYSEGVTYSDNEYDGSNYTSKAFDGKTDTSWRVGFKNSPNNGVSWGKITFNPKIPMSRLQLHLEDTYTGGGIYLKVNGVDITNIVSGVGDGNSEIVTPDLYGTYSDIGFELETIETTSAVQHGAWSKYIRLAGVEVDDVMLVDSPGHILDQTNESPTPSGTDAGAGGEITGSFATWSSENHHSDITYDEAGLVAVGPSSGAARLSRVDFGMETGKWYWEIECIRTGTNNGGYDVGICNDALDCTGTTSPFNTTNAWGASGNDGDFRHNSSSVHTDYCLLGATDGAAFVTGKTVMCAYDADAGKFWMGVNGTWGSNGTGTGNPATGANPATTANLTAGDLIFPVIRIGTDSGDNKAILNSGSRAFKHTAPSGFKCLCGTNIGSDIKPLDWFQPKHWIGDGKANQPLTGLKFAPDLVWTKQRNGTGWHQVTDRIRGGTYAIFPNSDNVESVQTGGIKTLDANGFTVGEGGGIGAADNKIAGFAWDAGAAAITPSSSYNITPTAQWANTAAGFSMTGYTGNGSDDQTLPHALGAIPHFVIIKNRDNSSGSWVVKHRSHSAGKQSFLKSNNEGDSSYGEIKDLDSNVTVTLDDTGNDAVNVNKNTEKYIMYAWTSIPGFSRFGGYTGNDGEKFIWCGFAPRVIMVKELTPSGNDWYMWDSWLDNERFIPNATTAPATATWPDIRFNANGFGFNTNNAALNDNSSTYMFAAWAEAPYYNSRAHVDINE